MPLARAVQMFMNMEKLLATGFEDPRHACDPCVVHFLYLVLRGWFTTAPQEECDDPWSTWAQHHAVDERLMKEQLAPTLDNVLESLLRTWKLLDPLCKDFKVSSMQVK